MEEEFNYDNYEKQCAEIRKKNKEYLAIFEKDLLAAGLSQKTVDSHYSNVNFYINTFLLNYEPVPMEKGIGMIDSFLGEYFIRKCLWSTPKSIKSTASSIKKFYGCMKDHGFVGKGDYEFLCYSIKVGMPEWQATCKAFNNPEEDNPFMDWF